MRLLVSALLVLLLLSPLSWAQDAGKLTEVTIAGQRITLGQEAYIVQSRLRAQRFVESGHNYGNPSYGYYTDHGITYMITFGPPKSRSGGYVVRAIERVSK
jgi:hypothetical protein